MLPVVTRIFPEFITLVNSEGLYDRALKSIITHRFHPWEGGEGKVPAQYKRALIALAEECMELNDYEGASEHLLSALEYPENIGEGKLHGTLDNDVYYFLGKTFEGVDRIQSDEYYKLAMRGGDNLSSAMYYNDQPPEMLYYQALAARALGDEKAARTRFYKLVTYGEQHLNDHVEIDYFAVSLPDFLIFEADLDCKNFAHCCFMAALGYSGLGDIKKAEKFISDGLEAEISHQGLIDLARRLNK